MTGLTKHAKTINPRMVIATLHYDEIHLIDIEQLGVDAGHIGGLGLVIVVDQFDLAAQESPPGVYIVPPDLHRQQCRLPGRTQGAGQRHAKTELKGLGRMRRRGKRNDESNEQ